MKGQYNMNIKIVKRKSISQIVEVKREKTLEELMAENDKLLKKLDDQFNNIIAEIKIINRIMQDKLDREDD